MRVLWRSTEAWHCEGLDEATGEREVSLALKHLAFKVMERS